MRATNEQLRLPICEALEEYVATGIVRFHMPGHKGGRGVSQKAREYLGEKVFALDVTGVEGLDDLNAPQGIIKEAEELAAKAFGADRTFFLVNGTSAGMHALIIAACNPGETIIVPRNMHKSILSGIILSGARPVFIEPCVDREYGIAHGVTLETVAKALRDHPEAKALLLINPTYYGVVSDLMAIVELAHRHALPVLVDEAHGPHLHFHSALPLSALAAGADACAQGAHKIIGGLTQASMLHVKSGLLDVQRLRTALRIIGSTSPSYVLMASLDLARRQMATQGEELLDKAIYLADRLRQKIREIPGLHTFGFEKIGEPGFFDLDPTKVTIRVADLGLTGQQVELILRYRYHIQVELSDLYNVLLIVSFGNTEEDIDRFAGAMADLVKHRDQHPQNKEIFAKITRCGPAPPIPEQCLLPREAVLAKQAAIPLRESIGKICAEVVTAYPPGIPIICPGEWISPEVVDYLEVIRDAGFRLQGPSDPLLRTIQIVKNV